LQPVACQLRTATCGGPAKHRASRFASIEKNLDAPTACGLRLAHLCRALPRQAHQHALDVLASAESTDAMIDAVARIDLLIQAADLAARWRRSLCARAIA
jgi:hypothetical protein